MAETESDEGTRKRRESEPDARCDSAPSSDRLLIQEGEASDQDASLALEHPAVTRKEVDAWMMVEWSNSPYSTVAISAFLPVCIQTAAILKTGFPKVCPNVVTDDGLVRSTFPLHNFTSNPVMYRILGGDSLASCGNDLSDPFCTAEYCRGLPTTTTDCLQADGVSPYALGLHGEGTLNPTAFVTLCISLSVVLQALAFGVLGPLADYGSNRKRFLTLSTLCGAVSMMAVLLVSPERYWLGGILIMLSNAAFGVSTMLSYAYLPVLLARLPDILDRSEPGYNQCGFGVWKRLGSVVEGSRRSEVTRQRSDELSNAAFGVGYIAGVLCLFLCTPFVIFATSMQATWDAQASILGFQLSMAITGLWWLAFYHSPYKHLHPRPGPPVARRGATWERALKEVVADMRKEPMTLSYLLLWFMFSDGVFVISSVASLFANSEVNWGCFPKSVGLLLIAVNAAVGAGIGSLLATRVQRCVGASTKTMLLGSLAVALTVPIYGLLGLFSDDLGFHEGWELLVFAGIYGLAIGPMQGFSRTLYGLLLPPGRESLYFALYQVTDKGSAMIGPLFISWVTQVTGSMRLSFIYSVFFIIVPGVILMRLDVEKGHRDRLASPAEAATDMEESAMENAPVVAT